MSFKYLQNFINSFGRTLKSNEVEHNVESTENNGLMLNSFPFPEEIIAYILSFVDARTLVFSCRKVCKSWKNIVDNDAWKLKIRRTNKNCISKLHHADQCQFTGMVFYSFFDENPIIKNLLRNNCGQKKFTHWNAQPIPHRGWLIEDPPDGSHPLPQCEDFQGFTSCFATTYMRCKKSQIVDLEKRGVSEKLLNEFQPTIVVSEWYAGRYDCGCIYKLTASLLDARKRMIDQKEVEGRVEQWEGNEWHKVTIIFDNYGPGVRFVLFDHEGKDTQFWAGHYGSKMAGGVVRLFLPKTVSN